VRKSRRNRTDKENRSDAVERRRKDLVLGDGDQGALTGLVTVAQTVDSSGVA
jgi:hypothetical protein